MKIQPVVKSLDDVPEALRDNYRQEGDVFVLDFDTDGVREHPATGPLARALDRVRGDNKTASDKVEELLGQLKGFEGLDAEKAREAIAKLQEQGDKDLIDAGKIDELLEAKTERMRADFEAQLAAKTSMIEELEGSNGSLTGELADIKIYDAIKDSALTNGARKEALMDIANRAKDTWHLEDGKPVAKQDGEVIFGKDTNPLTIDEWVGSLAESAAYLFEPNSGGGGSGGDNTGNRAGVQVLSMDQAGDNLEKIASGEAVINR